MRRVAIISIQGTARVGGVERVVEQQVEALRETHFVRVVALPRNGLIGTLRNRFQLFNTVLMAIFPLVSGFFARLRAGRRGVVISHGFSSIGLGCDIVFSHGCWAAYLDRSNIRPRLFGRLMVLYESLAVRFARTVVCVSDGIVPDLVRYYRMPEQKARVLPNTVNIETFFAISPETLVCTSEELKVIFVGRPERRKGLDYLEALHSEMSTQTHSVLFCIYSPTPVPDELMRRLPLFRIIVGLSPQRLAEAYNQADLFLLPSRFEGLELTTIEALACGTPALLNNTGSRPLLERLECPGLYRLEEALSPLSAIRAAAIKFHGLRRGDLSDWTARHFDERTMPDKFRRVCFPDEA